ncbi:stromal interaction molecule homolog isoform X1 [Bombus pascuorum]|uniref:stromal interaction molecule homolog isoform X1 n=1 Tax=Bombus pascuorum TaxID=65598 RepID=UPI00214149EB|nr:stromal interaction molecule homolog isoform X1 [Bombus pascuorum]XP_060826930.1 stromal interaction molecule homolog isoform X1 [Bombus pascuorum]XP_060826939.1 stromal interaction molecule homolog isoform X1 [Bombus pascuorum]
MRSSVITNVIVLFGLHLSYWCWNTVDASGGALDTSSNFQSGSTGSSHSKVTAFSATLTDGLAQAVAHEAGSDTCNDDLACLTLASHDRLGLEAIKSLHSQLDDDANGNVDLSESDDFLREELQYEAGYERRQRAFHHNDDMHISVRELWEAWLRSEVHNWTIEQTSEWLASNVDLPQYVPTFIQHRVTGATLPRLAVNNMQYLSNVLGIKDPIHKQKIALKAMDVVLFGPPKDTGHGIKDLVLITLLFGALIGCWYAYQQKKNSQKHLLRMMKDMESLHKAELALEDLQKELERARMEQESVTTEKQNLEKRLQDESVGLHASYSDLEVSQLKAEIEMLKVELQRAEGELEDRCWSPPPGLQHWLQLTHEIENKAYTKKKISAEKQLQQAREACEKLRKKRSSLVGAFVSTHGKSIDEVDKSIVEARTALNEVTAELQERVHRWKQIELLCGFNIINNNGLSYLETVLYRGTPNGRGLGLRGRLSSQDDLDDEASSVYSPSTCGAAGILDSLIWKESSVPPDSSSSETGKDTPPENNVVHFTVGDGPVEPVRASSKEKPNIVRSYSQDTSMLPAVEDKTTSSFLSKSSYSENSLDSSSQDRSGQQKISPTSATTASTTSINSTTTTSTSSSSKKALREMQQQSMVDDETLSTDSNSTTDNDESKKRRRKMLFTFRRNKTKVTL